MKNTDISRRQFAALAGAGWLSGTTLLASPHLLTENSATTSTGTLTARQIIARIQQIVGVPWKTPTVDTFKAGDPDTPVKGIATTFMSTFDLLQRAAKADKNLIITHEPTFYNHQDETQNLEGDPVYRAKQDFIKKNDLVIWRFHDHWHARTPDGVILGLAKALGWEKFQSASDQNLFSLPPTTLEKVARHAQESLKIRTLRVLGDPQTPVSKAALSVGYSGLMDTVKTLAQVDVILSGEQREWEGIEYAQDAVAAGEKKGLIMLGHDISEDPGMNVCAAWLKTFITEVPVEWIPAGEPFWRPAAPMQS